MHTLLLVFEFLGTTELMVIAVIALILFGPRKLPEIGRTVGKALGEFKRASDDFKRTWEYEVELERRKPALDAAAAAPTMIPDDADDAAVADADGPADDAQSAPELQPATGLTAEEYAGRAARDDAWEGTVARGSAAEEAAGERAEAAPPSPSRARGDDEVNAS